MKKHVIIPIFIPHRGCPNDCVFCNQKKITARSADVTPEGVRSVIEQYLPTIKNRPTIETVEVAFFGGSFTGLEISEQSAFLSVAKEYKDAGLIDKIHMSTRPDYINKEILDNLKNYSVDVVELGVQSFDEEVLSASGRGHTADAVYSACNLLREYNFTIGLQLMIGLPKDTPQKSIESAKKAAALKPEIARLYPTVVIKETKLAEMLENGQYNELTLDEAVETTKEMYKILTAAGVNVIRVGLKSTDLITATGSGSQITSAGYHPSFRQLVESAIAKESIMEQLTCLIPAISDMPFPADSVLSRKSAPQCASAEDKKENGLCDESITFSANPHSFSNLVGYKASNKIFFEELLHPLGIKPVFRNADELPYGKYIVCRDKP